MTIVKVRIMPMMKTKNQSKNDDNSNDETKTKSFLYNLKRDWVIFGRQPGCPYKTYPEKMNQISFCHHFTTRRYLLQLRWDWKTSTRWVACWLGFHLQVFEMVTGYGCWENNTCLGKFYVMFLGVYVSFWFHVRFFSIILCWYLPSLKPTSSNLEMDGWNTFSFPFGAVKPIFRGKLAVSFRHCFPPNFDSFLGNQQCSSGFAMNGKCVQNITSTKGWL